MKKHTYLLRHATFTQLRERHRRATEFNIKNHKNMHNGSVVDMDELDPLCTYQKGEIV